MNMQRFGLAVVAAALLATWTPVASASTYGELKWMASTGGPTSVPAGWVIIKETGTQYQIEYVGGAAYGAKVVVTLHSAVPTGWIITSVLGGDPSLRYLEYVTGAPYGTQRVVTLDSPVPTGWIICPTLGYSPGTRLLKCTLGATYGAQLRATMDSPVPTNWVIWGVDSTGRYIQYVAGAPFGTQIQVVLDSPVPANWMINQQTTTNRRLVCAVGATYGSTLTVILQSDVPTNWVITRETSSARDLMFVGGAAYQAKVTVALSSPVWPNWVVTRRDNYTRDLYYVAGAPQGTIVTVTPDSPVPPGWIVIVTNGTVSRDIRFGSAGVAAPTNLKGVKGGGFIQLTWDAVPGAIGYNVKQRVFKTNPFVIIAPNLQLNRYTDTNVSGGYTYYYIVTAIGPDGREGLPSAEIAVSPLSDPDAPTNLTATYDNGRIVLSWTAAPGAVSYNVKRKINGTTSYGTIANMLQATTYTDTAVQNGTKYFYVVTSINAKNIESGPSQEVSAIPNIPPAAPSGLTASAGNRFVNLSWSPSSGPDLIGYAVYRHNGSTQTFTLVQGGAVSTTTFLDSTVVNGQFYTYVVRGINSALQEGPSSLPATATPVGPPPPDAPAGLGAIGGDTTVSLSWPSVPGAMYYNVKRGTAKGGLHLVVAEPTGTTFTDTGLTNGVTYYYVVAAVDDTGAQSLDSVEASATPAPALSRPPAPNNLAAVGGVGSIALTWDTVGNAMSYKVYRSPFSTGPWSPIGSSPVGSYTDNLVLFGEVYYYAVSAVNGIGEGVMSDPVSATVASD